MKSNALTMLLLAVTVSACADDAAHRNEIEQWRSQRVERLQRPDGWLSLVGLHWLESGERSIGSAPDNGVQLATGPARLGTIALADGKVWFTPAAEAGVNLDSAPAEGTVELKPDSSGAPTQVGFNEGKAGFLVIERSGRLGLRVKDAQAPTRTGFTGIEYFQIDPDWRLPARFEPHPPGSTIEIASVINTLEPMDNPGAVVFEKDGTRYRLEAVDEGDGQLFLIFSDRTSGKTTYGAGRFLYAAAPVDGMTVLDFNKAYNPPCALNAYSTCPLPPPENRLDLEITAGEKTYTGPH
ncbi:MAG TPA: DUF1684 domain-containing protein [Xanthomonadaceae bacterium]|nr:DUF1684 domain-containing protein [Xanthomonadaceae bacterium]